MKTIKVYFYSLIFIVLIAGCSSNQSSKDLAGGDADITSEGAQDVQDHDQVENNQDNEQEVEAHGDADVEEQVQDDIEDASKDDIQDEETDALTEIEYINEILDLTPPEDLEVYTTGLVIVRKEEDLWRAVDRLGNVYRISTSAELKPGMVIEETQVSLDENGERKVELTSGYVTYNDTLIQQSGSDQASQAIAKKIFDQYSLGKILDGVEFIENIGSGIKRYKMHVTLENDKKAVFEFTIYGYEDTWLMPSASNINHQSAADTIASNESELQDEGEQGSEDVRREELFSYDKMTYYQEHELLPQSNLTQGTDIYEYMTNIYVEDGSGSRQLIHKGGRNNYYESLTQFGQRVYLKSNGWEPFSEEYSAGLGFLDLTDQTYKVLYNGPIIEGVMREESFYFFADNKLLELSLGTAKYDSVTTLPYKINEVILEIISVTDTSMRISLENEVVKKYEINLEESTIKEYNE